MYINANVNLDPRDYIGGRLYDFGDELPEGRTAEIYDYIANYSKNILVCYTDRPVGHGRYELWVNPEFSDINDLFDSLAIKEGADLIDHQTFLEVIAYYGGHREYVYLYPISDNKLTEIFDMVDASDDDTDFEFDNVITSLIDANRETLGNVDEHSILQGW